LNLLELLNLTFEQRALLQPGRKSQIRSTGRG
jgi:hypothetical protein